MSAFGNSSGLSKASSYSIPVRHHYFETMCGLVKEWATQDMVVFSEQVDFTAVEQLRATARRSGRRAPTYTAIVVKAISLALAGHPKMNRLVFDRIFFRRLVQMNEVHAAVAVEREVAGEDMAYSTILRHTDLRSLEGITAQLREVATVTPESDPNWRKFSWMVRHLPAWLTRLIVGLPRLFPSMWVKYRGGSFLITSPAKYGVEQILVKISWPLAFSFGQVKPRPMVAEGRVEARPACTLSMAFDRRLAPGAPAAKFFREIVRRLELADFGVSEANSSAPVKAEAPAIGLPPVPVASTANT